MVGGIVFLCQEVATPPSQMEEDIEVEADNCTISYNIKKVYGNGNPNSATTGINFEATVAIGNKNRKLKAQRSVTVTASGGTGDNGWYGTSVPTTLAWYYRWGCVNSVSYSQTIDENSSRYDMTDSKNATHATGAYLSNLKGTWYGVDTGNSTAGATLYLTIYYTPRFTVNLNGGSGPDGWTGPGITAANTMPDYLYYNTYNQSGTTAFPTATVYSKDPASSKVSTAIEMTLKPQRTGYTFAGYHTTKTGGYEIVTSSGRWTITRDSHLCKAQTIYAHWTANTYNLTANANGGSIPSTSGWSGTGTTASKSVTFDSSPGTMPKPTRTGYTLAGWYTSASGGTKVANADGSFISTVGGYTNSGKWKRDEATTLYAQWTVNNYNLKIDPVKGTYNNSTGLTSITQNYGTSYTYLTPTRTGYNFDGWHTGQNYLSSATTFNGSSTYVAIGRSAMYTDGISVAVRASMDNWAEFKTGNMRLVSCTEGGGWNFEPNGEYVQFACYDSGVGYKSAMSGIKWSELSSGYHTFVGTFDGKYATIYIDGKPYGVSGGFSSGKIGYHASNGIFIGAEAGSNATTPAGNYFKGTIDYVAISNSGTVSKPTTFTFPAYNSASTAQWTAKKFTLTFDGNGGGTPSPTSKTITYDNLYGELATISRAGYTFNGWWTSASGGSRITESTKVTVTANQTVYAHWTANQYTITANANSGINAAKTGWTLASDSKTSTMIFTYGQAASAMPTASRTGYTCDGWYTAASGGTKVANANGSFIASVSGYTDANKNWIGTSNTILYAHWTINKYTLKIDPNGGIYNSTTSISTFSQNYYTTKAIANPTRTGYTFAGWVATKEINGATWAQILYHFNDSGSQLFASSDNLSTQTKNDFYRNSQFANLARYNLTSYEFLLQYSHISGYNQWKQTSNPATTNNTISGYQAVSISWTDNAWGGIALSSTTASTFIDGSPGTGTWFYALGSYAEWSGGIPGPSAAEKQVTRLWLKTDSTLSNLKPTASFHNDDALGSTNYYYFKDEDITLKALWIVNSYTLTANANSGSIPSTTGWTGTGTTATKSVVYNTAYGTLPSPTRTGYGFAGWYTAASGGTQVSATTKMGAANTTIYAHWTLNSYALTANCNGGTAPSTLPTGWTANGTSPHRSVNYNATYGTLPEPTRQGYIFAGWWTAVSAGSEVNSDTKMGAADATIYAHWVESWVKYMSSDDPVIDQADGYYKIDSAAKLARLAYLVNSNADNGKWANLKYKQTADIDLSAHYWQPIGNATYQFKGIFDGSTFDIHYMKTYCGVNDYEAYTGVGMFGKISGATIKNVNNYDVDIKGRTRTGAITGRDDLSTIQNCRVTGKVTGLAGYIGGLVGASYKEKVIECENYAAVKGDFDVGGIVGNANETVLTNCINNGAIQGRNATGGIAGYKHYNNVVNCINKGSVTGTGQYIGGIVGSYAGANVQNCTNEGTVQGTTIIGGIVGYMQTATATISNGLNTGTLKATAANGEVGGIAGRVTYATTITSSFVDCSITPVSTSKVGGIVGYTSVAIAITYCGANVKVTAAASTVQPFYNAASGVTVTCNDSYSLVNNNGTKINRITATSSGMDKKFGMISSIHDGLPVPLGIYHVSQYGTTTGIASTLKGSKYGCTTA